MRKIFFLILILASFAVDYENYESRQNEIKEHKMESPIEVAEVDIINDTLYGTIKIGDLGYTLQGAAIYVGKMDDPHPYGFGVCNRDPFSDYIFRFSLVDYLAFTREDTLRLVVEVISFDGKVSKAEKDYYYFNPDKIVEEPESKLIFGSEGISVYVDTPHDYTYWVIKGDKSYEAEDISDELSKDDVWNVDYMPGDEFSYKIKIDDAFFPHGDAHAFYDPIFYWGEYASVVEEGLKPFDFSLSQNYPNPFNPTTTIEFSLAKASFVSLIVYNSLGVEVVSLVSGVHSAGFHSVVFDATNIASGQYFYCLEANGQKLTKNMVVLK